MKILRYLCIVATVCALAACKKDEIPTYDGTTSIYFEFGNLTSGVSDSTKYSLVKNNVVMADSIILLKAVVMGKTADYDRMIAVDSEDVTWFVSKPVMMEDPETGEEVPVLDPETGEPVMSENELGDNIPLAAVEGRDYEILHDECYIPADSVWGYVVIKLIGSDALKEASYDGMRFKLKLLPNEYFNTDYIALNDKSVETDEERKAYGMNSIACKVTFEAGTEASRLWQRTTWTDFNASFAMYFDGAGQAGIPSWMNMWGPYSSKKVELLVEVSGLTWEDWHPSAEKIDGMSLSTFMTTYWAGWMSGQASTWGRLFNREIARLTEENGGNPPLDEMGNPLELGPEGKTII